MVAQLLVLSKVVGLCSQAWDLSARCSQRLRGSHRLLPTFHRPACQANWKLYIGRMGVSASADGCCGLVMSLVTGPERNCNRLQVSTHKHKNDVS